MSDYLTMQNRIAREVFFQPSAALSGKQTEIQQAIQDAITFYESDLFWFNEQQATSSTVAGYEYYALPTDYVQMYALSLRKTDTMWETLEPLSFDEIEQRNRTVSTGRPIAYCCFNEQLRLSPVPDSGYDLRLSYLKRLPRPAADTDTSAWLSESEPMVRAKAKAILVMDASHNMEDALAYNQVADMWFKNLQKRTGQWIGTEQIRLQAF